MRPGYEEEYKQRHDEIWPEMVETLREAGVRNYSIFRHDLTLSGYFETDDLEQTVEHLGNSEVNRRWSGSMAPIMKMEIPRHATRGCRRHWLIFVPNPGCRWHERETLRSMLSARSRRRRVTAGVHTIRSGGPDPTKAGPRSYGVNRGLYRRSR